MPLYYPANGTYQLQHVQVALPLLSVGTTEVLVNFDQDFGNSTYSVIPVIEGGTLVIGLSSAGLKPGTRTGTSCTVSVKNTGLVSIAAGAVLHVIAAG